MEENRAYKEVEGKLYYELDFEFITQVAERMKDNKGKYDIFNWKRPMTDEAIDGLKQALFRHVIAVMKGEYEDDGRDMGHIESISANAMMLNYQLKQK